jgi:peroxiredoxin/YHS domain-containing protein
VGSLGEAPEDVPIRSVKTDKEEKVGDLKGAHGQFTALHFLTRTRTPECDAFVKEVLEKSPGLAGVRHVFIKADSAEEVKSWAAGFGTDHAGDFYADEGGKLAAEYGLKAELEVGSVKTNAPATIVLDGSGKVVVRAEGTHIHDHPKWAALSARIDSKRAAKLAEYNVPKDHLAVQGYDVVAYQDGKAREGSPKVESVYRGVTYRFIDAANRLKFAEDPEKYVPTYGGWCASAMGAKGKKVEIDPTNFKVKDGRLFLFYKDFFSDALKDWNKHEAEWEPAADRSWKGISGEATGAAAK